MGKKGVSFGYLEFSRASRRKPCPRARAGANAGLRLRLGFTIRSGSFWTGSLGYGLQRLAPDPPSGSETPQRLTENRREPLQRLDCFCLKRTVATVQTEPLQPFGQICPSRSAINSAPFLPFYNTKKTQNKSLFCILKWKSAFRIIPKWKWRSKVKVKKK